MLQKGGITYLKVEVHEILHSRVDITPSCKEKAQWEEERMKEPCLKV
jgi:hypothetical protein